jgi:hypothetical protein
VDLDIFDNGENWKLCIFVLFWVFLFVLFWDIFSGQKWVDMEHRGD